MLRPGPALRVVIHLNEDAAAEGDYLHREIVSFLFSQGISGATVLRGYAGFGAHRRLHTQGEPGSSGDHLPIRIDFIESEDVIERIMPKLIELVTDGIIEVQPTNVVHVAPLNHSREREDARG